MAISGRHVVVILCYICSYIMHVFNQVIGFVLSAI